MVKILSEKLLSGRRGSRAGCPLLVPVVIPFSDGLDGQLVGWEEAQVSHSHGECISDDTMTNTQLSGDKK